MGGRSGQLLDGGGNNVTQENYDISAVDDRFRSYYKGDFNEKTLNAYSERAYLVNYSLRDGKLSEAESQYVRNLDKALKKLPNEKEQNLYRGLNLPTEDFNSITKGAELNFAGYTSTTKDKDRVSLFMAATPNPKYKITPTIFKIVSHKTGKSIEKYSNIKSEQEVLFGRNSKFKVLNIEGNTITIKQI